MTTGFNEDAKGSWIYKDDDADLDYTSDWTNWLIGADTIIAAAWTIPPDLISSNPNTFNTVTATCWLKGGTIGTTYTVSCKITTANGRVDERSFRVKIKER